MKIEYHETYTKVYDSYKYSNNEIEHIVDHIIEQRQLLGLPVTRSRESYISEWKTHNRLYKIGYQRNRTKDVDLEEDIETTRNFLYSIFGF